MQFNTHFWKVKNIFLVLFAVLQILSSSSASAYWSIEEARAAATATTGNAGAVTDACWAHGICPQHGKYLYSYHVKLDWNKHLYDTQGNPDWPYHCRDEFSQYSPDFWAGEATWASEVGRCAISNDLSKWYYDDAPAPKDKPEKPCTVPTGNKPVKLSRGEKYYHFVDHAGNGNFPLVWERSYRENLYQNSGVSMAAGTWDWPILSMRIIPVDSTHLMITMDDGTGALNFVKSGGVWVGDDAGYGVSDTLTESTYQGATTGWTLTRSDGTVYSFQPYFAISGVASTYGSQLGYLTQITNPNGAVHTLSYTTSSIVDLPASVVITDSSSGNTLSVALSPVGLPLSVTDSDSHVTEYHWDDAGRLLAVTYPDGAVQAFEYDSSAQPQGSTPPVGSNTLITGIFEVSSSDYAASIASTPTPLPESKRYSKVVYDNLGRVSSSSLWNGSALTQEDTFTYSWTGWGSSTTTPATTMTTSDGTYSFSTVYNFSTNGAALNATRNWRLTGVNGQEATGSVSGCAVTSASTSYDSNGYLYRTSDKTGNVITQRDRDAQGRITTLQTGLASNYSPTTVSQKVVTTGFQGNTPLPLQKDYYGYAGGSWHNYKTETFTYDSNNRITQRVLIDNINNVSRTWTYGNTYYSGTTVLHTLVVTDPLSHTTTYNYNTSGQLTSVVDALNHETDYGSYNGFGLPTTIKDPNSTTTTTTLGYDSRGRLHTSVTAGLTTTIDYWPDTGLVQKVTSPDGSYLYYSYNSAHQLKSVSNQKNEHIDYTPSALNGKWTDAVTYKTTGTSSGDITQQQHRIFDALGRLFKQKDASSNNKTIFTYDANDNLSNIIALGSGTSGANDQYNHVVSRTYDGQNRISSESRCKDTTGAISPPYVCTGGATGVVSTTYTYDDQGNIATVTDAKGHVTSYTYNGFGELQLLQSPDTGKTQYQYDAVGNLHIKTKGYQATNSADTQVITYTWDALNRLANIDYPPAGASALDVSYTYDQNDTAHGKGIGHLTHVVDASSTTDYTYDALGNVTKKKETVGTLVQTTQYNYNAANQLDYVTYPSGEVITVGRDANHLVSGLTDNTTATPATLVSAIAHRPFGGITGWTTNSNSGSSAISQYLRSFDTNGRLSQWYVANSNASQTAYNHTLVYDAYNNISAVQNSDDATKNETYEYDALSRLTKVTAEYGRFTYSYDNVGNRTNKLFEQPSLPLAMDVNGIPLDPALQTYTQYYNEAYTIDSASNRVTDILRTRTVGGTTSNLLDRQLGYDGRGNIKTDARKKYTGSSSATTTNTYTLGNSDRLDAISTPSTTTP